MKKKHHRHQLGKKILMCILVASMVLGNVGAAPVAYALEADSQQTEAPLAQKENIEVSEAEVNSADETVDVDQEKEGEPAPAGKGGMAYCKEGNRIMESGNRTSVGRTGLRPTAADRGAQQLCFRKGDLLGGYEG